MALKKKEQLKKEDVPEVVGRGEAVPVPNTPAQHPEYDSSLPENKQRWTR